MIKLDISTIIFLYTLFSLILVVIWAVSAYRKTDKGMLNYEDTVWKCQVCSNVYVDSKHEDMSECPVCGSYNKKNSFPIKK